MGIEFWRTQLQTEEQKPDLEIRFFHKKKVMELTTQVQFIFKTEIMTAECVRKERNTPAARLELCCFHLLSQGILNNLFDSKKL